MDVSFCIFNNMYLSVVSKVLWKNEKYTPLASRHHFCGIPPLAKGDARLDNTGQARLADTSLARLSLTGRTGRRQGGDCEIDVSIENQWFTILNWKTKKIVFHNFYKSAISEIFILKGVVKDNCMKNLKILNLDK